MRPGEVPQRRVSLTVASDEVADGIGSSLRVEALDLEVGIHTGGAFLGGQVNERLSYVSMIVRLIKVVEALSGEIVQQLLYPLGAHLYSR